MKRRVLITGASRGIGLAIAKRYEEEKFEVITPRRHELDLSSPESVKQYIEKSGGLQVDVLINNAGENKINLIEKISLEDWQRMMNVNLTSSFLLIQAAAPYMASKGWGRIVNTSSCYSVFSRPGRAAYTSSKSGLNGLTLTAAVEYGERNVLVNAVCPGFVETDMTRQNNNAEQIKALAGLTALKRLAQPDEIAKFVYFLGSEQNSFITGQSILIDGGFSCS